VTVRLSSPDHTLFIGRDEFVTPKDWVLGGSARERIAECKKLVPVAAPIDVEKGPARIHVEQSPTVHGNADYIGADITYRVILESYMHHCEGAERGYRRYRVGLGLAYMRDTLILDRLVT
jgi:hypothetical protein